MRILVVGAGGHGQVVADVLLAAQSSGAAVEPVGFLDDDPSTWACSPLGLPVYGGLHVLDNLPHDGVVVGVGNNLIRRKIVDALTARGETFVLARHPAAIIGRNVELGCGTVICAGVVVNTGTVIGQHVILNTSSSVDHHNHIGDCVHVGPGARLGGDVKVGEGSLIGIGATVMPQQIVGPWAVVGAGAVVTKRIKEGTVVVGVPARPAGKGLT